MKIDVAKTLDGGRWSSYQMLLVALTAMAIILDGVDNALLPNALASLQAAWKMPGALPGPFATALSVALQGMMIGGALGGWLGDHIGRRNALLLSVVVFAVFTGAVAFVNSIHMLEVMRFLAGVGLGGAMPTAAALSSEYVPRRQRHIAVTVTIVCVPLGGMLAAKLAKVMLAHFGWEQLFLVGGGIPLVLAAVLFFTLPESPRFLARRPARWDELRRVLRRLGHDVPDDAQFVEDAEEAAKPTKPRSSILELFTPQFRGDTLALYGSFFFGLMANYIAFLVLPAALGTAGFSRPQGNDALFWWNLGGVAGALGTAYLIHRFGSRISMLGLSAIAAVAAFVMASMQLDPSRMFMLLAMCVLLGGMLNAVQTAMYGLAANVYPTRIRGSGIGSAVAVGRIGGALAPFVAGYALEKFKLPGYFSLFGIGMILTFFTLALVRRHIERGGSIIKPASIDAITPGGDAVVADKVPAD